MFMFMCRMHMSDFVCTCAWVFVSMSRHNLYLVIHVLNFCPFDNIFIKFETLVVFLCDHACINYFC